MADSMTPTIVISDPDADPERSVISDFNAPTAKCAMMLMNKRGDNLRHATHKEKRNDWNKRADGG
jgi:hypothetical protein